MTPTTALPQLPTGSQPISCDAWLDALDQRLDVAARATTAALQAGTSDRELVLQATIARLRAQHQQEPPPVP